MNRRTMLAWCLGALGLPRRPASAWAALRSKYRKLTQPVVLSGKDATKLWHPVWFDARVPARDPKASTGPNVFLKGVLLRLPKDEKGSLESSWITTRGSQPNGRVSTSLEAYCLTCPHEQCQVSYMEDTATVRLESAAKPDHPLLVCPCHFSAFDPAAAGARLAGPASRGLYRFRLKTEAENIIITEVEEDVLG